MNYIRECVIWFKQHGLHRSAVIAERQVTLKIKQMLFSTPVYEWERYLDASDPQVEEIALDWIERRIDPDTRGQSAWTPPGIKQSSNAG